MTSEDFGLLARDLGVGGRRMRRVCGELLETVVQAVLGAGEELMGALPALPYTAEDLVDDMAPRLAVVAKAAG